MAKSEVGAGGPRNSPELSDALLEPSSTHEELKEKVRYIWLDFMQMASFEADPLIVAGAFGIRVWTSDGREYIDGVSGAISVSLGYGNQAVCDAVKTQIDQLQFWPVLHSTTPPALNLAEKLAGMLPGSLNHVFLLSGGSEATETAMKMARQYHLQTGSPLKEKIISRYWGYHGSTKGALSASGVSDKQKFGPFESGYIHVLPPYCYRCPFGKSPDSCNIECARAVETTIRYEGRATVSAVIVDPIMAAAGVLVPPKEYYQILREICTEMDVLLIFDEVMTGFGRVGKMFAAELYDVVPDIICLGKGIASCYQPLAATVASDKVAEAFRGGGDQTFLHGNTYGGHPVACAAGLATISEIERLDLVENSAAMGSYMLDRCKELQAKHSIIGDVRGAGLLLGLEMVRDRETREQFPKEAAIVPRIRDRAMAKGLLTRGSLHVLILAPALIVTRDEVDEVIAIVDESIGEVERELGAA
jgi:adenosylmethionine-8-amino-7-oxononanoate aminotransferase